MQILGNICVAGHNYDDGTFFSDIPKLNIGDEIHLSLLNGISYTYTIYEKYETSSKDTTCTNQETNGNHELTLVTCNNFNGNRIIIKALEIKK